MKTNLIASKSPNNDGVIPGTGEDHIWVFRRRSEGGDPSRVSMKTSLVHK